jgi:hypothetical protein
LGLGLPFAAHAAASHGPAASALPAATTPGVLTLYSDPDLKGRHATYKTTSLDVERQGFVARSAASTGMWTLCEGGEVASRCQSVDGQAPELKLSPQIVRPGLNALEIYDQPGFKGHRIIYSFPADRPAPFHARSARTWGGAWALCDRGYRSCQSIDGRSQNLDLVVAAVRPEPAAAIAQTPVILPAETPAPILVAAKPTRKVASTSSRPARTLTPAAALPRASRLVRVAAPLKKAAPARAAKLTHVALVHPKPAKTIATRVHETHVRAAHPAKRSLYLEVRNRPRARHQSVQHRLRAVRLTRYEAQARHPSHARLVRVSERHSRHAHAMRRRLYRRVRLFWGGSDPYLYAADPRAWGPPPPW